jgi:hypothetical protein
LDCRCVSVSRDVSRTSPINVGGQVVDIRSSFWSDDFADEATTIGNDDRVAFPLFIPTLSQQAESNRVESSRDDGVA